MKKFKPLKAPNKQLPLEDLTYPLILTPKRDGFRMIVKSGKLYTCSLKPFVNKNMPVRFKELIEYTQNNNVILDGELYSDSIPFTELSGILRSFDKELPEDLYLYMFDVIVNENPDLPYINRCDAMFSLPKFSCTQQITHIHVNNAEETKHSFDFHLKCGLEGVILRNPNGIYKFGRATLKENIIYKLKPYETYDSQIIEVIQATEVREGAEKKTNELGRSVTSKKKEDRVLIDKASAFLVLHNNLPLKVSIALTDVEKKEIWENKETYVGKWIEYKGMEIGAKNLPRHPVLVRFREDK